MKRVKLIKGELRLEGGICASCDHPMIPRRSVCPACGAITVEQASFGPLATVKGFADLTVPVDDVAAPYFVGLVQLMEGPIIFTRIFESPSIGQTVYLAGLPEEDRYWFETNPPP